MNLSSLQRVRFALVLMLLMGLPVLAQIGDRIQSVSITGGWQGEELTVQIEFINPAMIDRLELAYRQFGERDYRRVEMSIRGNVASAVIPASEVTPPFIEYYVLLFLRDRLEPDAYPIENPEAHPLRADVRPREKPDGALIVILSPDPNERLETPEDLLISFSLLDRDSIADPGSAKVFLNGADLTSSVVSSGNLFVLRPGNGNVVLSPGLHTVRVELSDRQNKPLSEARWSFSISTLHDPRAIRVLSPWQYSSSIQLETRNETIGSSTVPYHRGSISATSVYQEKYRVTGRIYGTNEEKDYRQPQNRFFIGAESPWLRIGYGDSYPAFPELVMSGRRVRGLMTNLSVGFFNLALTTGDIIRRVESEVITTFPYDSLSNYQADDQSAGYVPFDTAGPAKQWAKVRYGTFNRNITAIRPSFGRDDRTHFGLTYLKSKDDVASIRYGHQPRENLVVGSDLLLLFDNRNIEIGGEVAFSATNNDITSGTFTDADIERLFSDETHSESDRNNIRRMRDIGSRFITVNEHLVPLHLKNITTLAYEGMLGLNYFDNAFRFRYVRRGNNYESFGQPFLRRDVVGFSITDRHRISNAFFVSGGLERLQDNTAENKPSRTTATTGNVSLSYISRSEIPSITVGYLLASNTNGRGSFDDFAIDDQTNRFLVQFAREFGATVRHSTSLNIATSVRDDRTPRNLDTRSTTVAVGSVSTLSSSVQATLRIAASWNTYPTPGSVSTETNRNYASIYAGGQYRLQEGKVRFTGALIPTFGDIKRTVIDMSAQYYFYPNLSAQSQLGLYLNEAIDNDVIWSLVLRLDV